LTTFSHSLPRSERFAFYYWGQECWNDLDRMDCSKEMKSEAVDF